MKRITLLLFATLLQFTLSATDYYWVGGAGTWSDLNHWRTSSGGTEIPTRVPSQIDNVYFDANSGFTSNSYRVTIDATINCHDITFENCQKAPQFDASEQNANIYGSAKYQTGMKWYFANINDEDSDDTNKTITSHH